jgi:hypothetical protein
MKEATIIFYTSFFFFSSSFLIIFVLFQLKIENKKKSEEHKMNIRDVFLNVNR